MDFPCADTCGIDASVPLSTELLNRECFCFAVDRDALHAQVEAVLRSEGLPVSIADSHPHLFSSLPVFVSPRHLAQAARVAAAVEEVVASGAFRAAALRRALDIARFDPGSPGGLLGLDFHLDRNGPRLIEVNTNPGGVLLNALMTRAQRCCLPSTALVAPGSSGVEEAVFRVLVDEWDAQRGGRPRSGLVAIVDEAPHGQYLYPEFLLFRQLLKRRGIPAEICDPARLVRRDGGLWLDAQRVGFVYNRLTDFMLEQPAHAALRDAFLAGEVAMSPHPQAHALYADKRNLVLLGDRAFLHDAGIPSSSIDTLAAAVPETRLVTQEHRDGLWAERRDWFFKPAAGFGSRASYRGDKLTRRVWDEIGSGTYVAQKIVPPSLRHLASGGDVLKVDIRCYAYRGRPLLYAARLYQGQTTNFRTPGGGFAPVLTGWDPHDETGP